MDKIPRIEEIKEPSSNKKKHLKNKEINFNPIVRRRRGKANA
jgi:hypothetical protein